MGVAYNSRIVTENLVLCLDAANTKSYPGSGTTWTDLSGRGNTGTLVNGVGYSSSNRGALTFDGTNDGVQFVHNSYFVFASADSYSLCFWFYAEPTTQSPSFLFSHQACNLPAIQIYLNSSAVTFYRQGAEYVEAFATYNANITGRWNYLVGTFDGVQNMNLYINGANVASAVHTTGITPYNAGSSAVWIGRRQWCGTTGEMTGKIAQFSFYKGKGLTQAEVSQNYNALRGRFGSDDPGNGQGYSIAQSASSTNGVYTSASPTNYISSWYLSVSGNGTPLNYTCSGIGANFAYHTGHNGNSSQWPMYHAIQVSTNTYGQVINRINWYKHSNACGNVDIWGTTRAITSQNYTDTSLYTYLGRVNMGGFGSAGDCNVSSGTFNSSSYGYNWILLQVQDISGALSYPSVGTLGGWAMYGMQLVKQ